MKVEIVSYSNKYSKYFYELNYDWLNEFFYVEEYDEQVLRNCKSEIIDKGGYIFFALNNSQVVGTMALIFKENGIYELNKMAVKKDLRGNGIGHQLIQYIIDYSIDKNFKSIILYSFDIHSWILFFYFIGSNKTFDCLLWCFNFWSSNFFRLNLN